MHPTMRKTPSYLKGLAETRARAAGDLERALKLLAGVQQTVITAQHDLAACDRLIRKFDASIDPDKIPAIRGYQGRYGQRGKLADAVADYLCENAPCDVGTLEVALALQAKFGLEFGTAQERSRWVTSSVAGRLRKFVAAGLVERLHDTCTAEEGRWRWKQPQDSLSELRERALRAGVPVDHSSAPGQEETAGTAAAAATEATCHSVASSDAGLSEDRLPPPAAAR